MLINSISTCAPHIGHATSPLPAVGFRGLRGSAIRLLLGESGTEPEEEDADDEPEVVRIGGHMIDGPGTISTSLLAPESSIGTRELARVRLRLRGVSGGGDGVPLLRRASSSCTNFNTKGLGTEGCGQVCCIRTFGSLNWMMAHRASFHADIASSVAVVGRSCPSFAGLRHVGHSGLSAMTPRIH